MTLWRCFAVLSIALFTLVSSAIACGGTGDGMDGGTDGKADGNAEAGAPVLVALSVTSSTGASPALALVPPFSSSIHDYYVRCPATTNELTVSMQANPGNQSQLLQPMKSAQKPQQTLTKVSTKANQAVVAAAVHGSTQVTYWVRCLPSDFPPIEMVASDAGTPPPGYYLVGNFGALNENGAYAMVLDGNGVPVWYYDDPKGGVCDVDCLVDGGISFIPVVAQSEGLPFELFTLSPWKETPIAPKSVPLDIHELRRLKNGNYVAISDAVEADVNLTGLSVTVDGGTVSLGASSTILACNIVEFTPAGTVVWTWKAIDSLDPRKVSLHPEPGNGYLGAPEGGLLVSVFHCNSVDVDEDNDENLLVSARQTDSFFYIEKSSKKILWKMGGANATLDDAPYIPVPSPAFNGQHDVRLQPGWSTCAGGQISMFDDETYSGQPARALVYDVTLGGAKGCKGGIPSGAKPKATLSWHYTGTAPVTASGSFRISPDGSRVIGWGLSIGRVFTEVDDAGHDLLDLESNFAAGSPTPPMGSYRAVKVPISALDIDAMRKTAGLPTP